MVNKPEIVEQLIINEIYLCIGLEKVHITQIFNVFESIQINHNLFITKVSLKNI